MVKSTCEGEVLSMRVHLIRKDWFLDLDKSTRPYPEERTDERFHKEKSQGMGNLINTRSV